MYIIRHVHKLSHILEVGRTPTAKENFGNTYSRPRFKDTLLKETPRYKDTFFFPEHGAPKMYNNKRGVPFPLCAPPPKFFLLGQHTAVYHRQRSAAARTTACGYGEIPPICWRVVSCRLEAMWRTHVAIKVSTRVRQSKIGIFAFLVELNFGIFVLCFCLVLTFGEERCPLFGVFARFFCMLWSVLPTVF